METDQLNGLIALKMVAEKKNFTAAAEALRVSPPAVSQAIKQLERRLGVALFARTTRSTSLTEAGARFLEQAGPALDQILQAMDGINAYTKKPSGRLRLNLPKAIYPFYLAPRIASFTEKYPDITVELCFEDAASDVVAAGFDAGIRLSDILAKDAVALKLFGPARFVTAASPRYLAQRGRPKHPKDLLGHRCVCMALGKTLYDRWDFAHKGKDFQVHVKGNLTVNDSTMATAAALAGSGVVYHLRESVMEHVGAGKLELVLESFAASSAGFYLYYPRASQVLPKLRVFIEHLKATRQGLPSTLSG